MMSVFNPMLLQICILMIALFTIGGCASFGPPLSAPDMLDIAEKEYNNDGRIKVTVGSMRIASDNWIALDLTFIGPSDDTLRIAQRAWPLFFSDSSRFVSITRSDGRRVDVIRRKLTKDRLVTPPRSVTYSDRTDVHVRAVNTVPVRVSQRLSPGSYHVQLSPELQRELESSISGSFVNVNLNEVMLKVVRGELSTDN